MLVAGDSCFFKFVDYTFMYPAKSAQRGCISNKGGSRFAETRSLPHFFLRRQHDARVAQEIYINGGQTENTGNHEKAFRWLKQVARVRRPVTGVDENGQPLLSDPDGRPFQPLTSRK